MATKTFDELKQLAIQIRDEKTNKQNTATRVGTEMLEHLNKLEQDYYDKTTINNRTSEYNVSLNHPTSGLSGSNKYDLSSAIAQVPAELRTAGLKVSFLNSSGKPESWKYQGGSWAVANFIKEAEEGNKILTWAGDVESTRKQVLQKERKKGLQISYTPDGVNWINEQYIGPDDNGNIWDSYWSNDSNWQKFQIFGKNIYTAYASVTGTTDIRAVSIEGYDLSKKIRLCLQFSNSISTDSVSLNINGTGSKTIYYNNSPASKENSWSNGELLDVYYDGTYYQAYSISKNREIFKLEYDTDKATTRAKVPLEKRSIGTFLIYSVSKVQTIIETYIGSLNNGNIFDTSWKTDGNWITILDTSNNIREELLKETKRRYVEFLTDVEATRLSIPSTERSNGMELVFTHPEFGPIKETFIGNSIDDYNWKISSNWNKSAYIQDIYRGESYYKNWGATRKNVEDTLDESVIGQEYMGGYIEIQPDSWDGENCPTDSETLKWGFPQSLSLSEQARLKFDLLPGNGFGIMYIRLPLGFGYRGYRNIDESSGLTKNIGERYQGQNTALKRLFENIAKAGGGLAPEYWCFAPHWLTTGLYAAPQGSNNYISAGGSYPRSTLLSSIKISDETQYNKQIEEITNAILDDLEYLHQNISRVRMFSLSNEPDIGNTKYGACIVEDETYSDIMEVLWPKIQSSEILNEYNGEKNEVLLYLSSRDRQPYWGIGSKFIEKHPDWIWGYSYHGMRLASGEGVLNSEYPAANMFRSTEFSDIKGEKKNVFINEYEYFENITNIGQACSNNMLYLINQAVYSDSLVMHPIIHILKPIGQTEASTNTKGYGLMQANLQGEYGQELSSEQVLAKGTYMPVTNNYNSWCLFKDNLPIGSYLVGGKNKTYLKDFGWCAYKSQGKLLLFMANRSTSLILFKLTFSSTKTFLGKLYNNDVCGAPLEARKGESITFEIPSYSGLFYKEIGL